MNSFDATTMASDFFTQFDTLDHFVTDSHTGRILDFSDSDTQNILERLADPSNFPGCTANSFQSESWVPSVLSGAAISCTQSAGSTAGDAECASSSDIQGATNGCAGCLDAQEVLLVSDNDSGDVDGDLTTRYAAGGDCGTWATEMQNVWDNYYSEKETRYETNGIVNRKNTAAGDALTYHGDITTVGNIFDTTMTNLDGIASTITDPQYGIIAGFNCRLFGEDLELLINTFCARFFNVFYFLRLATGILSFAILFAMCCSVCAGVRHFKHAERKDRLMPGQESTAHIVKF